MEKTAMTIDAARFELIQLAKREMDYLAESKARGFELPGDSVDALLMALGALRQMKAAGLDIALGDGRPVVDTRVSVEGQSGPLRKVR